MPITTVSLAAHSPPSPVGGFDAFLLWVRRLPRLDADEERTLALHFHSTRDPETAKRLALANLYHVVYIARRYEGYGLPLADLVQEGTAGLLKAIRRFDPACGVRLLSYAIHWVRAEINGYVLRNWRIVRRATTKADHKLFFNKRRLAPLESAAMEAATDHDTAALLSVDYDEVRAMRERLGASDVALDALGPDDTPGWQPVDTHDPLAELEDRERETLAGAPLQQALSTLDPRSRDIVARRWLTDEPAGLAELGREYGISAERVRQIQERALKQLRTLLPVDNSDETATCPAIA